MREEYDISSFMIVCLIYYNTDKLRYFNGFSCFVKLLNLFEENRRLWTVDCIVLTTDTDTQDSQQRWREDLAS